MHSRQLRPLPPKLWQALLALSLILGTLLSPGMLLLATVLVAAVALRARSLAAGH